MENFLAYWRVFDLKSKGIVASFRCQGKVNLASKLKKMKLKINNELITNI